MAIYPKKSKDPTEVALSAIQDALNVRDADIAPPVAASMAGVAEASSDARKRAPRMPRRCTPAHNPVMTAAHRSTPAKTRRRFAQAAREGTQ